MSTCNYIKRLLISSLLLLLPVPWFAGTWLDTSWFGLPLWLLYSIAMTLLMTLIIALLLQTAWDSGDERGQISDKEQN